MSVRDEYADYSTYLALSRREKNPAFKKALEELAQQERRAGLAHARTLPTRPRPIQCRYD